MCAERWCQKCRDFHDPKRGCFIRPLEPTAKAPCRFIAFDMETMQHQPADDPSSPAFQQKRRRHEPNFICAKVACADCILSGQWKQSLRGDHQCKVCGDNRTITFSEQPFNETKVDQMVVSRHPLVDFVKWILYKLPLEFDSYVFSHYGKIFEKN